MKIDAERCRYSERGRERERERETERNAIHTQHTIFIKSYDSA